jgi:hypothetical protein
VAICVGPFLFSVLSNRSYQRLFVRVHARSGPNGKNRRRKIYPSLATQEFVARRKTLFSYFARHSCEQK